MRSSWSEDLVYRLALDFVVRFLKSLGPPEATNDSVLGSTLEIFVDALSKTLGKRVYAFLWRVEGREREPVEALSIDPELGPPGKWLPSEVGSVKDDRNVIRDGTDSNRGLIAAGFHFEDKISFDGELWVVLPDPDENVLTFLRHLESWKAIKLILRFVIEQSIVQRFLAITPGLFDDQNSRSFLSSNRLGGLKELGLSQCPPSMAPGFEDVLTTFVQAGLLVDFETSATGSRRELGRPTRVSPLESLGTELCAALKKNPQHQPLIDILNALEEGEARHAELASLSSMASPESASSYDLDREAQAWLAEWTGMLGSSNGGPSAETMKGGHLGDKYWGTRLESMLAACGRFLGGWSLPKRRRESLKFFGGEENSWEPSYLGAPFITPWLRLWFCYELLRLELTDPEFHHRRQSQSRRLRYRRSLIYVLRENVRFFLFWWRADYRFRPRLLARELRRLVVHHAERALGIDGSLDLTELLQRIERSGDAGARELASGHLQHVFEVYIAGQFLGSLEVGKGAEPVDLWSHWARRPDTPASLERPALRRSFAIAALLHDFGGLLFPSWGREIGGVRSLVQAVEGDLSRLATDLEAAGQRLGDTAMATLRQHDGLFSDKEWEVIERWQEERIGRLGEPEPAVTGAWYVRSLMRQAGLGAELQRHVARAMVLDRITTLPIDLETDPVAALLVVCDSLFVWEPSPPRRDELVIGRTFSSLQASGRSVAARYDSMSIPGLCFGFREQKTVKGHDQQVQTFFAGIDSEATARAFTNAGDAIEMAGDTTGTKHETLPWGLPSFHLRSGGSERNDAEACLDLWLELSLTLGRIGRGLDDPDRSPPALSHPWIRVITERPAKLAAAGLDIEDLVGEVAQLSTAPLRRALERWLARKEKERRPNLDVQESTKDSSAPPKPPPVVFDLDPRGRPFAEQDPRPWFEELRRQSERVILQRLAIDGEIRRRRDTDSAGTEEASS